MLWWYIIIVFLFSIFTSNTFECLQDSWEIAVLHLPASHTTFCCCWNLCLVYRNDQKKHIHAKAESRTESHSSAENISFVHSGCWIIEAPSVGLWFMTVQHCCLVFAYAITEKIKEGELKRNTEKCAGTIHCILRRGSARLV